MRISTNGVSAVRLIVAAALCGTIFLKVRYMSAVGLGDVWVPAAAATEAVIVVLLMTRAWTLGAWMALGVISFGAWFDALMPGRRCGCLGDLLVAQAEKAGIALCLFALASGALLSAEVYDHK